MKFDTLIIGSGLAGVTSGIRLMQSGQRCAIVSTGKSALHFSSGSFDLLNALPNSEPVETVIDALPKLAKQAPNHPYNCFNPTTFMALAKQAKQLFNDSGIACFGSEEKNHYRFTPFGTLSPTWLTLPNMAISDTVTSIPWQNVLLVNILGFLDFYPDFIAYNFQKLGINSTSILLELPKLDRLRKNPSEFRSINLSYVLDEQESLDAIIAELTKQHLTDYDAILLPACLTLLNKDALTYLNERLKKPVIFLPTLPPSLPGIKCHGRLINYFIELGGQFFQGDTIETADMTENRVNQVYSKNHTDIPFIAEYYILASGSFFSSGLASDAQHIYEPIFNLDVESATSRSQWYQENIFDPQPYLSFGLKYDNQFNAQKNGKCIENLYVAGAGLSGFDPIKLGCGAGVSLLTALHVANQIIAQQGE